MKRNRAWSNHPSKQEPMASTVLDQMSLTLWTPILGGKQNGRSGTGAIASSSLAT